MRRKLSAAIAQLGERQTEDLKVPGSIPGLGTFFPTSARLEPWVIVLLPLDVLKRTTAVLRLRLD